MQTTYRAILTLFSASILAGGCALNDPHLLLPDGGLQDGGNGHQEDATAEGDDARAHDGSGPGNVSDGPFAEGGGPGTPDAAGTESGDGGCGLACDGGCFSIDDVSHCGACGNDCSALPHVVAGTTSCASSKCSFAPSACSPGWADCNGDPSDGCETDLTTAAHCG